MTHSFSSGLGLLDYLNWCEDLNMEPIMAVWAGEDSLIDLIYHTSVHHMSVLGYSLDGSSVAAGNLQPYVQQAIDQVNPSELHMSPRYAMRVDSDIDAIRSTSWSAVLRVAHQVR